MKVKVKWRDYICGMKMNEHRNQIQFYQLNATGKIRLVVRDPNTFKLKLNENCIITD